MAYIRLDFLSESLRKIVPLSVVIPNDVPEFEQNEHYNRPTKVIYLLHGFTGNHTDWITGTTITTICKQYNLAVVCPSGDNSFYLDREMTGGNYGEYVGKEIVDYTRKVFGFSPARENTIIGGFSMGGYGALRNGLKYYETFGKIFAFSSALVVKRIARDQENYQDGLTNYAYSKTMFGDLDKLLESDKNPEYQISNMKTKDIPELYLACGTEDFIYDLTQEFHQYLIDLNINHEYFETSGGHDWIFWNKAINEVVDWLVK